VRQAYHHDPVLYCTAPVGGGLLAHHHGPVHVLYCTVLYLQVKCNWYITISLYYTVQAIGGALVWPTTMDLCCPVLYCTAPVGGMLLAYHHGPVHVQY
jgi:hypothetical protein